MVINNRFIKFAYEKNNKNLKFKNDNLVHVIFYSESNSLLSSLLEKDKDLLKFFEKIIKNNSTNKFLIRTEKGNFLLVKRKVESRDLTNKYLEDLGGTIFNSIKSISCNEAKIYENDDKISRQICLGILLGSY